MMDEQIQKLQQKKNVKTALLLALIPIGSLVLFIWQTAANG